MKVAVISVYRAGEPGLERLCESVKAQTHPCTHILVADGPGDPDLAARFGAEHLQLSDFHDDYRTTGRSLGAMSAFNRAHDAVTYLDPPSWADPDHIASFVTAHEQTTADIVLCWRSIRLPDGTMLPKGDPQERSYQWLDPSCTFVTKQAAAFCMDWAMMDRALTGVAPMAMSRITSHFQPSAAFTNRATVHAISDTVRHRRLAGQDVTGAAPDPADDPRYATFDPVRNEQRTRIKTA